MRRWLSLPLVVLFTAGAGGAWAQANTSPPQGPAPTVQATEAEKGAGNFEVTADEPAPRPNHPPMHLIPQKMPMDPPVGLERFAPPGPGAGVMYNAETGETTTVPAGPDATLEGLFQGGGYSGADGGVGSWDLPASFGAMSLISNTEDFPWRMNVKLVARSGASYWVCSGTMRDAETVLTAGHCVFDFGGVGWPDEIWIYPGWDGEGGQWNPPPSVIQPYGYGHSTSFGAWTGWTASGDHNYDVGIIGLDRAVGMLTGWFGWSWGGDCATQLARSYNNASYPAEGCDATYHTGTDMYYRSGTFDSCPSWNRLQVDTVPGCFTAVWGGMSGSGAYYFDAGTRYVHGVCSTSDRLTYGRYSRQFEEWVNWNNSTFIPNVRGAAFDLQALDVNAGPATIRQGEYTTLLNHLATNPTDGAANGTWAYDVYLSSNDNISTSDTLLSHQSYNWDFGAMGSVTVNMAQVQIPYNTPPGSYWIGLVYAAATDGDSSNNDTDGWDAVPITVTAEITPPTPSTMTWATEPYETSTSSITMVATTASDPTAPVEYFFDYTSSPTGGAGGSDSAWQASTSYTDAGLSANHQYGYRVKARDGNLNETSYSATSLDYTDIETPTGISFGAITTTSIQAASANAPSGLTRGSSGLLVQNVTSGTSSGWKQDNNLWTSTPLSVNTRYGFSATARNGDANATPPCATAYRYTLANAPGAAAFSNVTTTSLQANWTANGNPAGTQFYCENTTAGTNSGWTTASSWNSTGLTAGATYAFRVKARNGDGIETGWVSLGSQATLPGGPTVECRLAPDVATVPRGGALGLTATLTNTTSSVQAVQFASRVKLPNGTFYPPAGYLFGPYAVTLNPLQSRSGHLSHNIPAVAPLGSYTYYGYALQSGSTVDECSFTFTVTSTLLNPNVTEWGTSPGVSFGE